jgi:hypothetical protein
MTKQARAGRFYVEGRPLQILRSLTDRKMRDLLAESANDPIRSALVLRAKQGNQKAQADLAVALACDEHESAHN